MEKTYSAREITKGVVGNASYYGTCTVIGGAQGLVIGTVSRVLTRNRFIQNLILASTLLPGSLFAASVAEVARDNTNAFIDEIFDIFDTDGVKITVESADEDD